MREPSCSCSPLGIIRVLTQLGVLETINMNKDASNASLSHMRLKRYKLLVCGGLS